MIVVFVFVFTSFSHYIIFFSFHKTGVSFVADTNITCSGTPTAPAPVPAPASATPASATPASSTPAATPSPSSARRRMLLSSNATNGTAPTNSSTGTPSPSANAEGDDIHSYSCPDLKACTCPAGTTEVIPSGANKIAHGGGDPRSFVSGK